MSNDTAKFLPNSTKFRKACLFETFNMLKLSVNSNRMTQLKDLVSRYGTDGTAPCAQIPFLYIARFDSVVPPLYHLAEPTVSIMVQGTKRILLDEKIIEYKAGEALVNSVGLPMTVHMSNPTKNKPLLAIGISLNPSIIASLMFAAKKQKSTVAGFKVANPSENLMDAVLRIMKLLDHPEDIPVLAKALEKEIHWRILQSDLGGVAAQLGRSANHTMQIGNAINWIRANFNKTLRIERLAKLSAMSPTSFHRHFRRATSMSPIQYQKKIRLQEARVRLMSSEDNIASVGFAVGYESPSQFSREYRREFGVSPKGNSQSYHIQNGD